MFFVLFLLDDPHLWLVDPDQDQEGPKTYESYGSGLGSGPATLPVPAAVLWIHDILVRISTSDYWILIILRIRLLSSVTLRMPKKVVFILVSYPQAHYLQFFSLKNLFFAKIWCWNFILPALLQSTFMRKGKYLDPLLWLMNLIRGALKHADPMPDPDPQHWPAGQGCGSGSGLDPDSIGSVDPDPYPGGQKWPTKEEVFLKFMFWSVGWPLWELKASSVTWTFFMDA